MTMKKSLSILVATLMLGTFSLIPLGNSLNHVDHAEAKSGGYSGPTAKGGSYSGPGPAVMTIKDAYNQADDTWVTLQGKLINHVGGKVYTFQDASGTGKVKVDNDAWSGQNIGPNDVLELLVEVDKDWGNVELEVERIIKK